MTRPDPTIRSVPLGPVGQAVVTDPVGGTSSGYRLVGVSPSVPPVDKIYLESSPQVSDDLHLEENPGVYLSFCRLPSGSWGLTRRFAHGKRRGSFNRIVVHTLVFPEQVLRATGNDPWLLFMPEMFRPWTAPITAGRSSFAELNAQVAVQDDGALPDLACLPPDDPRAERHRLLRTRIAFLQRPEFGLGLRHLLSRVFDAVVKGRTVLLRECRESEELLAAAWSSLPANDRRTIGWTTHLAPGSTASYGIAICRRPRDWLREHPCPDACLVLDPRAPEQPERFSEPGADALARAVLRGAQLWDLVENGLEREDYDLSLSRAHGEVARWVRYCELGRDLPATGWNNVESLREALYTVAPAIAGGSAPWFEPAPILRSVAATVARLTRSGVRMADARDLVLAEIRGAGLAAPLLSLDSFRRLTACATSEPSEGVIVAAGAALAMAAPSSEVPKDQFLGVIAEVLLAMSPPAASRGDPSGPLQGAVLEQLAACLLAADHPRTPAVLERVGSASGSAVRIYDELPTIRLRDLLVLVDVAGRKGDASSAATLLGDHLVPLLAKDDPIPEEVPLSTIEKSLEHLQAAPKALATALAFWRGDLFDIAAGILSRSARNCEAAALETARHFVAIGGRLPHDRNSIVGLAEALSRVDCRIAELAPFLLAECAYLDRTLKATATDRFSRMLKGIEIRGEDIAVAVREFLSALSVDGSERALGACHRLLMNQMLDGCVQYPEEMLEVCDRLLSLLPSRREQMDWAPCFDSLAECFAFAGNAPTARSLRLVWWERFISRRTTSLERDGHGAAAPLPRAAKHMFLDLDRHDRRAVFSRVAWRLESPGELTNDIDALESLAVDLAEGSDDAFRLGLARLVREYRARRRSLEDAVSMGEVLAWIDGEAEARARRRKVFQQLLAEDARERTAQIVLLIASDKVWESTKRVLEREELPQLQRELRRMPSYALPSLERLRGRPCFRIVLQQVGSLRLQRLREDRHRRTWLFS